MIPGVDASPLKRDFFNLVRRCIATGNLLSSSLIGFIQSGVGAVLRTVHAELRDRVSVKQFGVVGDGTTDDTAAIQAADTAAAALGKVLFFPAGTYTANLLTVTAHWRGESRKTVTIKRRAACPTGAFISASGARCSIESLTVDCNKAGNSNGCNGIYIPSGVLNIELDNVRITGAKANSGWGGGVAASPGLSAESLVVNNCLIDSNDASGLAIDNAIYVRITNNIFRSNGASGCVVNNYDVTFAQKVYNAIISGNKFLANGQNGCDVGNYVANNNLTTPDYGIGNEEIQNVVISGNLASANGYYGLTCAGQQISMTGNVVTGNCTVSANTAGILADGYLISIVGNTIVSNLGTGIEAGGCNQANIAHNTIFNNSIGGLNLESSIRSLVTGNTFSTNGPVTTGVNVVIDLYGGASSTQGFTATTSGVTIEGNFFHVNGGRYGIKTANNPAYVAITNNKFIADSNPEKCIVHVGTTGRIEGNKLLNSGLTYSVDGSGKLVIPDVEENAIISNSTTVASLQTGSTDFVGTGVAFCTVTAGGSGYTSPPTVNFVGGTGSGAAATSIISAAGVVTGIRMTSFGAYTVAPTSVTLTGGGGSSATASLQWKLPLLPQKKLRLHHNAGGTLTRAGAITINNPAAADIVMAAGSIVDLMSTFGAWYLCSKNF